MPYLIRLSAYWRCLTISLEEAKLSPIAGQLCLFVSTFDHLPADFGNQGTKALVVR